MIRIRGPVGTLRVLMLPGESDSRLRDEEEAAAPGTCEEEAHPLRETRRDQ